MATHASGALPVVWLQSSRAHKSKGWERELPGRRMKIAGTRVPWGGKTDLFIWFRSGVQAARDAIILVSVLFYLPC